MYIVVGLSVVLIAVAPDEVHPEGVFTDISHEVVTKGSVNANKGVLAAFSQHIIGAVSPDKDVVFIAAGEDVVAVVPQSNDGYVQVSCGKNVYSGSTDVFYPANRSQGEGGADDCRIVQAWDFFNSEVRPADLEVYHGRGRGRGDGQQAVGKCGVLVGGKSFPGAQTRTQGYEQPCFEEESRCFYYDIF